MWPEVDELLKLAEEQALEQGSRREGENPVWSNYGFLTAMQMLRTAFLQDAVFLKRDQPSHPLWDHPFFKSEKWEAWEKQMFAHEAKSIKDMQLPEKLRKVLAVCICLVCSWVDGGWGQFWASRQQSSIISVSNDNNHCLRTSELLSYLLSQTDPDIVKAIYSVRDNDNKNHAENMQAIPSYP